MGSVLSILRYEYKMQITRIPTWGVLLTSLVFSLLDNFPSGGNLHRLEFLTDPAYLIYRAMSLDGLLLAFGCMILLSNRFPVDQKTGVKALIMAGPTTKEQYIWGKMLGGLGYTATLFSVFLAANALIYILAAPFQISAVRLSAALVKGMILCALPVSVFVGFVSVNLPALMDVRLFYAIAVVLLMVNASTPGTSEAMPRRLTKTGNSGCLRQQTTRISGCHSAAYLPRCEKSLYFFSVLLTGCGSPLLRCVFFIEIDMGLLCVPWEILPCAAACFPFLTECPDQAW